MTSVRAMGRPEAKVKHQLVSNNNSKGPLHHRRLHQELVAAELNLQENVAELKNIKRLLRSELNIY